MKLRLTGLLNAINDGRTHVLGHRRIATDLPEFAAALSASYGVVFMHPLATQLPEPGVVCRLWTVIIVG
jgi:hypothetical protein